MLRVSHNASAAEIKAAYYKFALQLHPDKHKGNTQKLDTFKQVNEAYDVLSDQSKRNEYDFEIGLRFNKGRRTKPPHDYRKVYTSRPPPHWKTTWDHVKHHEMHYGDGMQNEAIKHAKKTAEKEGVFDYRSPLGEGFTFSEEELHGVKFNPYSKRPQGPPKVVFAYEERSNMGERDHLLRRERIVEEMHTRRRERHRTDEVLRQQEEQQRYHSNTFAAPATTSSYAHFSTQAAGKNNIGKSDECIIL